MLVVLKIEVNNIIVSILKTHIEISREIDAKVQELHKQARPGDFFRQITLGGLEICGEILRREFDGNWLTCNCYSFSYPEGEVCFVHILQIKELINRKMFESMKDNFMRIYQLAIKML